MNGGEQGFGHRNRRSLVLGGNGRVKAQMRVRLTRYKNLGS
jgi:hypothetical protein